MYGKGITGGIPATRGPQTVRNFSPVAVTVYDQTFRITGRTLNTNGALLANCAVHCFSSVNDAVIRNTDVSDANGNYTVTVRPNDLHYLVAYQPGSPDIAGTTINTLVGS